MVKNNKKITDSAYAAFQRFHEFLKKRTLPWRRWMDHLSREIPKPIALKTEISNRSYSLETEKDKLSSLIANKPFFREETNSSMPSTFELDAFRMKAISLLKHHEVRFTSWTDQLHMIREVPIVVMENPPFSKAVVESIVAMQQVITPFPGESIELKGAFKRYPQSNCHSVPIPESFHMNAQAHQTGFPHPSQHHGWALSSILLGESHPLKEKMGEIASKLMPEGSLNQKAKEMLRLKQHCFNTHTNEFLKLHLQLNQTLLKVAGLEENQVLEHFFAKLKTRINPFHHLSLIHQHIVYTYLENKKCNYPSSCSQHDLDYIILIGKSYQQILKMHKPLMEALALKQLGEFIFELEELNPKSSQDMFPWLQEMLWGDRQDIQAYSSG